MPAAQAPPIGNPTMRCPLLIFTSVLAAATLVGLDIGSVAGAQEAGLPIAPGGLKRAVRFSLVNHDPGAERSVTGQGTLRIEADVTDSGGASRVRRVVARAAVYERPDPSRPTPGRFIGVFAADGVMESPPEGDRTERLTLDIPLAPGDYAFYLILCDPDRPAPPDFVEQQAEKFGAEVARALPGPIFHASLFSTTVLPRP